jgi:hypothetical protein
VNPFVGLDDEEQWESGLDYVHFDISLRFNASWRTFGGHSKDSIYSRALLAHAGTLRWHGDNGEISRHLKGWIFGE